mgnify:CR=1 FL=1
MFSVSPTVKLSILYPLRLNNPETRLNTPAVLSTKIDNTIFFIIGISDFINQVEECLKQAAGGSGVAIEPTQEPQATPLPEKQEPQVTPLPEKQEPQEGTRVDGITGASYSSRGLLLLLILIPYRQILLAVVLLILAHLLVLQPVSGSDLKFDHLH